MELAIIKLQEELDYETHLLERGFYKNKTDFDSDGTEQDCKNRIESYKKAIKIMENRKKALAWWGSLTDTQKWENRNKVTILDGRTWQNLTGIEIEMIWRNCA